MCLVKRRLYDCGLLLEPLTGARYTLVHCGLWKRACAGVSWCERDHSWDAYILPVCPSTTAARHRGFDSFSTALAFALCCVLGEEEGRVLHALWVLECFDEHPL